MKVAIDISPLSSGHSIRGVGFYVKGLQEALLKEYPNESFVFFQSVSEVPSDVDLIHVPYFDPFSITLPYTKKKKMIVTIHDLTPLVLSEVFPVGMKGRAKWEMQKMLLKQVDHVITDSDSSKKDVIRIGKFPESKITTVYLAAANYYTKTVLTDSQIRALREKYSLPETFLLYVGDVTPNKNLPRLIEASLKAQVPLVMVGKALSDPAVDLTHPWNKDVAFVRNATTEHKTLHRLGFVPNEDLAAIYTLATAFIMPSLYEGFGLPILEAMQTGAPVITTNCGSLPEVAGEAAYYVDPLDVSHITSGIIEVIRNKTLQETLRQKGFIQAKKFTWDKTARDTVGVYEKILAAHH